MTRTKTFSNCKLCIAGKSVEGELHVDLDTGNFTNASNNRPEPDVVNLGGKTIAPGYLELQSNVSDQWILTYLV